MSRDDVLGLAHDAERTRHGNNVYLCLWQAVADQMQAEGLVATGPSVTPNNHDEIMIEARRRYYAVLNRQICCPAWDTCTKRLQNKTIQLALF